MEYNITDNFLLKSFWNRTEKERSIYSMDQRDYYFANEGVKDRLQQK